MNKLLRNLFWGLISFFMVGFIYGAVLLVKAHGDEEMWGNASIIMVILMVFFMAFLKYYEKRGLISGFSNFKIDVGASDVNNPRLKPGYKFSFLKFLFPKKYREEWLGDMNEILSAMKEAGQPNWWINLILILHFFTVIFHAAQFKLSEFFDTSTSKKRKAE